MFGGTDAVRCVEVSDYREPKFVFMYAGSNIQSQSHTGTSDKRTNAAYPDPDPL